MKRRPVSSLVGTGRLEGDPAGSGRVLVEVLEHDETCPTCPPALFRWPS